MTADPDRRLRAEAAFNRGHVLMREGDLDGALAAFRDSVANGGLSATVNVGKILLGRGDLAGAEVALRFADEHGIGSGSFNLGVLLAERGDLESAEAAYRSAASRGVTEALVNLGNLLRARGDYDGALAALTRADEAGTALGAANLGSLMIKLRDLDAAERAFLRARDRGFSGADFSLGLIYEQRGELAAAVAAFRRVRDDDHANAAEALARLEALQPSPGAAGTATLRRWRLPRRNDRRGDLPASARTLLEALPTDPDRLTGGEVTEISDLFAEIAHAQREGAEHVQVLVDRAEKQGAASDHDAVEYLTKRERRDLSAALHRALDAERASDILNSWLIEHRLSEHLGRKTGLGDFPDIEPSSDAERLEMRAHFRRLQRHLRSHPPSQM